MMRIANQHNGTARRLCLELQGRFLNPYFGQTGLSTVGARRSEFAGPAHWRKADSSPK
jgi:hypothetical protein